MPIAPAAKTTNFWRDLAVERVVSINAWISVNALALNAPRGGIRPGVASRIVNFSARGPFHRLLALPHDGSVQAAPALD